MAGFVMASGALSSKERGEGVIRQKIVQADLVDAVVMLPDKLFFNTTLSPCLWFVARNRHGNGHRSRTGEVLFIDARKLGTMVSRKLRDLTDDDIARIASTYHAWRNKDGDYEDVSGFCRSALVEEIADHDYVLTPGRYVGAEEAVVDDEPIDEKIERLASELFAEFERGRELEDVVRERVGALEE